MRSYTVILCLVLLTTVFARPEGGKTSDSQTRDALDDFEAWRNKNQQQQQQQSTSSRKTRSVKGGRVSEDLTQQRESAIIGDLSQHSDLTQQTQTGRYEDLSQQTQRRQSGNYAEQSAEDTQQRRQQATVAQSATVGTGTRSGPVVEEPHLQSAVIPDAAASGGSDSHYHVTQPPTLWQKIQKGAEDAYRATVDTARNVGEQIKETVG